MTLSVISHVSMTRDRNLRQKHTGTKPVHSANTFCSRRIRYEIPTILLLECWVFCSSCKRVLMRSSGWKRIVEHVPENEPARNDFTTADLYWPKQTNDTRTQTHTTQLLSFYWGFASHLTQNRSFWRCSSPANLSTYIEEVWTQRYSNITLQGTRC